MKKNIFIIFFCVSIAFLLSSCSSTPAKYSPGVMDSGPGAMHPVEPMTFPDTLVRHSTYHTVAPGETLWRISKMYDVDVDVLKSVNKIRDVSDIDIGTKLYIPEAAPRKDVLTFYPSRKWKYIIIHHSATDKGNCEQFDIAHKKRGWKCVGYDFVIDNGSYSKDDGQIEMSPRWIKQENGAHCKASGMNEKGIGICLVGNFSEGKISEKQMKSLVHLVKELKKYYNIPDRRVLGHSQVPGAQTECPGKYFPWKEFKAKIK